MKSWARPSRLGVAVAVVLPALAMGALHTWVLCLVAGGLAVAFAAVWWGSSPLRLPWTATLVGLVAVALTGWTLVQLLPLPTEVLAAIAPTNAEVWSEALAPLREPGPSHAPVSLDPGATRVQVLRGVVYMLTFGAALRIAARREGLRFLEWTLVTGSLVMALVAAGHAALDARRVWGLFAPDAQNFARMAPILNPNHLAAYLNVGSAAALGIAVSRKPGSSRLVPAVCLFMLVGTQIWVGSRAGTAASFVAIAAVLWLTRQRHQDATQQLTWLRAGVAVGVLAVSTFVVVYGRSALDDLSSRDLTKLIAIRGGALASRDFAWVGMGRGAFESVYPAYRGDHEGNVVYTHPENIAVQWAIEWGFPVAVLALAVLAFALLRAIARGGNALPAGPAAALVGVFAHNLLDFNLEIPGVAIPLAVCAGCVFAARGEHDQEQGTRSAGWTRRPRVLVGAATVAALGAIGLAAPASGQRLDEDQRMLRELAASDVDEATFAAAARGAMLRHPADPYLALMGAVRAARVGDGTALLWLGKTLRRASVYGRAHFLLARQLAGRSPSQARMEYRLAMEQDPNLGGLAIREGAKLVKTPEDALQLIPDSPYADNIIELLSRELRATNPAAADRLEEELARRDPGSPAVARRSVDKLMQRLRDGVPPCDRQRHRCIEDAEAAAVRLMELEPSACHSHLIAADLRVAKGESPAALDELERSLDLVDNRGPCARRVLELALAAGKEERATRALDRLVTSSCTSEASCADAHLHAAAVEEGRRRYSAAYRHARKAEGYAPSRNDVLARVAALAALAGLHRDAAATYERLQARDPSNPAWKDALAREQDASTRGTLTVP